MADKCCQCGLEAKLRLREFSHQALAALVVWGEIEARNMDKAMCEPCYGDLREILIDRADEILIAATQPPPAAAPAAKKAKKSRKQTAA
jgi:hypothetical protein